MDCDNLYVSQEIEAIFEVEEFDSSVEQTINESSSLNLNIAEDNKKKVLYEEGLFEPGSGEVCAKYISMSQTSVLRHLFYNYPAVKDPGIKDALFLPEKLLVYPEDGKDLYIATCKTMRLPLVRSFIRNLQTDKIDLSYYCVDPYGIRPMAMAITDNKNVKVLNLTESFLNDDACHHLGKMLIHNSTLHELNLSFCKIKPTGVKRLLQGIARNKTLKILNLAKNDLSDEGAEYVAKAFQEGFFVEVLNLSYNNINARGATALAVGFETPTRLVKLNLSWNNFTARGPVSCLMAKLGEIDTLQDVDLSWNALEGARIGSGINILMKAQNLKCLHLNNNNLTGEAITNLTRNMHKASNLVTLDLSFNPLTSSDAINVLKKIKPLSIRVQNLLMENVDVTSEFLELMKEVKNNKNSLLVTYGKVKDIFKPVGTDMRELVLKRADYLLKKSKKKQGDYTLKILDLVKNQENIMNAKDYTKLIRGSGAKLDADLVDTIIELFPGPSTSKNRYVDLNLMADYIKKLWPDRRPLHTYLLSQTEVVESSVMAKKVGNSVGTRRKLVPLKVAGKSRRLRGK